MNVNSEANRDSGLWTGQWPDREGFTQVKFPKFSILLEKSVNRYIFGKQNLSVFLYFFYSKLFWGKTSFVFNRFHRKANFSR